MLHNVQILEEWYNTVAWAVRHNTGHFPTLQCRRDNKGPFPCRFPIFHARLCVWLQLLAMSNMCAWIFPRDIVELDIFKGRSDPRIGGGSPTSLLRPRVGGRTRPSEFFLTSAPSACSSLPPGCTYVCWSPYVMCWTSLCPLATSDRSRLRKDEGWGPGGQRAREL